MLSIGCIPCQSGTDDIKSDLSRMDSFFCGRTIRHKELVGIRFPDFLKEIVRFLELDGKLANYPSHLSGGQQQRVAIARALVTKADIILADEPTGALDQKTGQELMALLCEINEEGKTILLVTHDEKVASVAKKQIRIQDGICSVV